jgi:EAL domain-containing protein (putative c-di-GMP-specific phosphodiesterase class I)
MPTRALPRGSWPLRRDERERTPPPRPKPAEDLRELERSFDRALTTLTMAFQPIVSASTGQVFGYEALLRTADADLPHPGAMLDAAERLSCIHRLSRHIRALTATQFGGAGRELGLLFVNLHAADFIDHELAAPDAPLAALAQRVVFEVTERASLDEIPDIRDRVEELRGRGYRIAIDDLGAGHSRSNLFRSLSTDFVKLDMSLVRGIEASAAKRELVASIIRACKAQDIRVVGEGVETAAEGRVLVELGCDLLQGYHFARPGPPFPAVRGAKP